MSLLGRIVCLLLTALQAAPTLLEPPAAPAVSLEEDFRAVFTQLGAALYTTLLGAALYTTVSLALTARTLRVNACTLVSLALRHACTDPVTPHSLYIGVPGPHACCHASTHCALTAPCRIAVAGSGEPAPDLHRVVGRFKDETRKLRNEAATKYFALYRLALSVNDREAAGITL